LLHAQDTFCPAYPQAQAAAYQRSIARTIRPPHAGPKPLGISKIPRAAAGYDPGLDVNFIDTALFQQMATDGIQPAGAAEDAEFLRRVTLDVTGRIPSPQQVRDYTSNTDPGKKAALLSTLIGSKEYTDYWTTGLLTAFRSPVIITGTSESRVARCSTTSSVT